MENILHDFEEKVISLMTEFLKSSMETGGLSNFTDNLLDNLIQLGYDLTKFSLEYAEDIIFKIKERKFTSWGVGVTSWKLLHENIDETAKNMV